MTLERINPEELARPSGFAHAVRARGTTTVHLAGQTALDRDGCIVGETVVEQFERNVHAAAGRRELHGVRQQIPCDLLEPRRIRSSTDGMHAVSE